MAAMHHVPAAAETDLVRIAAGIPFGSVALMPEAARPSDGPLVHLDGVTKSFARRGAPGGKGRVVRMRAPTSR